MNMQEANVTAEQVIAIKEELAEYLTSDRFHEKHPDLNVLTVILSVSCLLSEIVGKEDSADENKKFIKDFIAPLICATFDPIGTPLDLSH